MSLNSPGGSTLQFAVSGTIRLTLVGLTLSPEINLIWFDCLQYGCTNSVLPHLTLISVGPRFVTEQAHKLVSRSVHCIIIMVRYTACIMYSDVGLFTLRAHCCRRHSQQPTLRTIQLIPVLQLTAAPQVSSGTSDVSRLIQCYIGDCMQLNRPTFPVN